ncbi:hypothetical protein OG393_30950 [Streptomyces sp. NBC_01216]|uniref:hypothetical protein n=1 Tax=Streptomyces sp. NBC_01216 TaxID=2903778 RepID=UPI002E0D3B5B|nr:hypothetical protein OG393_30950 [Streptomyces sp. NBC_01216]
MRVRRALAALLLAVTTLLTGAAPAEGTPGPAPAAFTISGVDLHDTVMREYDGTYYLYGTMYGCGFRWGTSGTPWCGFGVSTAPASTGPWTQPQVLFDPASLDPWAQRSWQTTCGGTGQGCFNPRMIRRTGWGADDGVYILWFNAPRHWSDSYANAYNVMGCAGPSGPCGQGAVPNGSYNKPALSICGGNGDFGLIDSGTPGGRPAIVCTQPGATELRIEQLNHWGSGGTGVGVRRVAGLGGHVEGPGGWWDPEQQQYVLTYSDQGCGYCAGTPIGYATSPSLYSGWTAPGNVGWGAPAYARRTFSTASCGGQPRTVTVLDGQPWQIIDLWLGTENETAAPTHLVPLHYTPTPGTPGDGQVWRPPLTLDC